MLGGFIALPMTDQWASGITQSKLIKAQGAAHPPLTLPVAAAGVPAVARWGSRCGWQRMAGAKALREAMLTGMGGIGTKPGASRALRSAAAASLLQLLGLSTAAAAFPTRSRRPYRRHRLGLIKSK